MFLGIMGPNQIIIIIVIFSLLFGPKYVFSSIKKGVDKTKKFNKEKDELTKPIKDIKRNIDKMKKL